METIEVRYTPLGPGYYHQYIVYTDSNGNQQAARGGPSQGAGLGESATGQSGSSTSGLSESPFGNIKTDVGSYDPNFVDYDPTGSNPFEIIASSADLSDSWNKIKQAFDDIGTEQHPYRALTQNCNTTVAEALKRAGLPEPVNDGFDGNWSPGAAAGMDGDWFDDLKTEAGRTFVKYAMDFGNTINGIEQAISNALGTTPDPLVKTTRYVDPLILDLDGDGLEITPLSQGIQFDTNGDAIKTGTAWAGADDGLLVRDLNGNGSIDSGAELFGDETVLANGTKAANGFAALAKLDSNGDGKVDANDANFSQLRVWKDADSNAQASASELLSLDQAGVQSLAVGYTQQTLTDAQGNQHLQAGQFTGTDGLSHAVDDVWFAVDTARTVDLNPVAESEAIAALPDVAGFGNVHSLHQAMARDSSGHLQSLVQQFAAESDPAARQAILTTLVYAWAGVENIDPASRAATQIYGNVIGDARKLASLEAFLGEGYMGTWCWGERNIGLRPHFVAEYRRQ